MPADAFEMSLNPAPYEPVRREYHLGKVFTNQDSRGAMASGKPPRYRNIFGGMVYFPRLETGGSSRAAD
jgi:hypothetical protein